MEYQGEDVMLPAYNTNDSFCRLCGNTAISSTINVFIENSLVDLIDKYLSIKISKVDALPSCICEACKYKIESFHEFAVRCQDFQDILVVDTKKFSVDVGSINVELKPEEKFELKCKDEAIIKLEDGIYDELDCKDEFDFGDEDILPLSECIININKSKKKCNSKSKKKTVRIKSKQKQNSKYEPKCRVSKKTRKMKNTERDHKLDKSIETVKEKCEEKEEICENFDKSYLIYKCHVCDKHFQNWYDLEKHGNNDHAVRPRIMCICKRPLYSMSDINRHIKKHGKNASFNSCQRCNKVFLKKTNFERHMLRHSNSGNTERLYECNKCSAVLISSKSYNKHMSKHRDKSEINAVCTVCNRVYASQQSLKIHMSSVHEKIKPFVCDVCGHAFHQKNNLQNHVRLHSERPFLYCEYCPRKFTNKRYLTRHILCHAGVSFKCPVCPAVFNYQNTLKNHMYIHQNVKRYVCGFCNKGFKWQSSLKTHVNIHTGATPHACPWCPRTFSDRSNCRLHKRKHHPKELAEYEQKNGIVHLGKTLQFDKKDACVLPLKDPSQIKLLVYPNVNNVEDNTIEQQAV